MSVLLPAPAIMIVLAAEALGSTATVSTATVSMATASMATASTASGSMAPGSMAAGSVAQAPAEQASAAFAAPSWRIIDAPPVERGGTWEVQDLVHDAGLRNRVIFDIDFAADGTVWLATADGVRRYDGYEWHRIGESEGLPSAMARSICVTRAGEVWIGTDRGIARLAPDGAVERLPDPPAGSNVRRITETRDGALWISTDTWLRGTRSGLSRWSEGSWTSWGADDLPNSYVHDLVETPGGDVWVLTVSGAARLEGDRWVNELANAGHELAGAKFWTLVETPEGLHFGIEGSVLHKSPAGRWTACEGDHATNRGKSLVRSGDELLLVDGTGGSILRWAGDGATEVVSAPLMTEGLIERMRVAPDGSVWAVGYDVLVRWSAGVQDWTLRRSDALPIAVDPAGRPWLVDGERALVVDGEQWIEIPEVDASELRFDADGSAWWITSEGPAWWSDEARGVVGWQEIGISYAGAVRFDPRGRLWLGPSPTMEPQFALRQGTAWRAVDASELVRLKIHAWAFDAEGVLWCVAKEDVFSELSIVRLSDSGVIDVEALPDTSTVDSPGITVFEDSVHVFGDFGLRRRADEGWVRIDSAISGWLSSAFTRQGELWMIGSAFTGGVPSLMRFSQGRWRQLPTAIDATIGSRAEGGPFLMADGRLYRPDDASADWIAVLDLPVASRVRAAVEDALGRAWISTDIGLWTFDPGDHAPDTVLEPIEPVQAGVPLNVSAFARERFHPRTSAASYSWRLNGGPWSPFRPMHVRSIAGIDEPGAYRLEVRARNAGLRVDPTPAAATIQVVPLPLSSRPWFAPAVAAGSTSVLFLTGILVAGRVRSERRARILAESVAERTSELRTAEARLRTVFDHMPFEFWVLDRHENFLLCNAPFRERAEDGDASGEPTVEELGLGQAVQRALAGEVVTDEVGPGPATGDAASDDLGRWMMRIVAPIRVEGGIAGVLGAHIDITARRHAELQRQAMLSELDHRVKNNMATVLSLVELSRASATSLDEFVQRFSARVAAMARAHEALAEAEWRGVGLRQLLRLTLGPYEDSSRSELEGPACFLAPRQSNALALCLHELATNAAKHGAFSAPNGRMRIQWTCEAAGRVRLCWEEWMAKPAPAPEELGFGLQLVQSLAAHDLHGSSSIEWTPSGLRCTLWFASDEDGRDCRGADCANPEGAAGCGASAPDEAESALGSA